MTSGSTREAAAWGRQNSDLVHPGPPQAKAHSRLLAATEVTLPDHLRSAVDRLVHHAGILALKGDSYRLRDCIASVEQSLERG